MEHWKRLGAKSLILFDKSVPLEYDRYSFSLIVLLRPFILFYVQSALDKGKNFSFLKI